MTKDEIKAFLKEKPGYLKEGAARLSEKLNCSVETCRHALTEARIDAKGADFDLDNVNQSEISEFKTFLKENGINILGVVPQLLVEKLEKTQYSVKKWFAPSLNGEFQSQKFLAKCKDKFNKIPR